MDALSGVTQMKMSSLLCLVSLKMSSSYSIREFFLAPLSCGLLISETFIKLISQFSSTDEEASGAPLAFLFFGHIMYLEGWVVTSDAMLGGLNGTWQSAGFDTL